MEVRFDGLMYTTLVLDEQSPAGAGAAAIRATCPIAKTDLSETNKAKTISTH
jgi:hypothetical protein